MSTAAEVRLRVANAMAARDEAIIRKLLGMWVSEFEPAIAYRNGDIIGLCVAGDPSGSIPVRVFDTRPLVQELMRAAGVVGEIPSVVFGPVDYGYD